MTKKDYIKVAKIVQLVKDDTERFKIAKRFVEWFRNDNPLFSEDIFLRACHANHPLD